jgi:hypothetical protein
MGPSSHLDFGGPVVAVHHSARVRALLVRHSEQNDSARWSVFISDDDNERERAERTQVEQDQSGDQSVTRFGFAV